MPTNMKNLLVTGATGKQGGAVIRALLTDSTFPQPSPFHIFALTRSTSSASAQRLAGTYSSSSLTLIAGDLSENPAEIFAGRDIWGVFSVQTNSDAEETQGKAIVSAAANAAHVPHHFVYASGDRGGTQRSREDPTFVKNFAAKFAIEQFLREHCVAGGAPGGEKKGGMGYTVLRPVTFFDNLTEDVHGRGFARMWEQMGHGESRDKKLQMVAVRDVGWFGAKAFMQAHAAEQRGELFTGEEWSLAGDELTWRSANAIYQRVRGKEMALAPCLVATGVKFVLKGTVGDMFKWFQEVGYGADVDECRRVNPGMWDFQTWLETKKQ